MGGKSEYKNGCSSNTTRIAKNTIFLYFRQILIMLVSLYTVRVVLNVLGAEDYGIYNVVAGVVTMFSFLSGAMASASQRYFSFDLGKGDIEHLKFTFSVTLSIYLLLIFIVVILAETVGLWFVNNKLVIPQDRMNAAKWIYQFAVLNFVVTMITTPYMASIIAHENMDIYAYVSIIEAALKLAVVFVLKILPFDKLIVYGILLFAVGFINTTIYRSYCKKHYEECRFRPVWDGKMFKEITGYVGLDLYGNFSVLLRTQGVGIIYNLFFGPIMNAAVSIATSVQNAVMSFSSAVTSAVRPQIIKNYSAKKIDPMIYLINRSSLAVLLLLIMLSMPIILESHYILTLWLGNIPEYASVFCSYTLVFAVISAVSGVVVIGAHATGNIKRPSFINGTLYILVVPISYFLFKKNFPKEAPYLVNIIMAFLALVSNIYTLKLQISGFKFVNFFLDIVIRGIIYFGVLIGIGLLIKVNMNESFLRLLILCIVSIVTTIGLFLISITKHERERVVEVLRRKLHV